MTETTTNSSEQAGMVFKLKFLRTMLPIMTLDDASFLADFYTKWGLGALEPKDKQKLNELYSKFEKRAPDAQISKT